MKETYFFDEKEQFSFIKFRLFDRMKIRSIVTRSEVAEQLRKYTTPEKVYRRQDTFKPDYGKIPSDFDF